MAAIKLTPSGWAPRTPKTLMVDGVLSGQAGGNVDGYGVYGRQQVVMLAQNNGVAASTITIPGPARGDGRILKTKTHTIPADGKLYGILIEPVYRGNYLYRAYGCPIGSAASSYSDVDARTLYIPDGAFQDVTDGLLNEWTITDPTGAGDITFIESGGPLGILSRVILDQPSSPTAEGQLLSSVVPTPGNSALGVYVEVNYPFDFGIPRGKLRFEWSTSSAIVWETLSGHAVYGNGYCNIYLDDESHGYPSNHFRARGVSGLFQAGDYLKIYEQGIESTGDYWSIASVQAWRIDSVGQARQAVIGGFEAMNAGRHRVSLDFTTGGAVADQQVRVLLCEAGDYDNPVAVLLDHYVATGSIEQDFTVFWPIDGGTPEVVIQTQRQTADPTTDTIVVNSAIIQEMGVLYGGDNDLIYFDVSSADTVVAFSELTQGSAFDPESILKQRGE